MDWAKNHGPQEVVSFEQIREITIHYVGQAPGSTELKISSMPKPFDFKQNSDQGQALTAQWGSRSVQLRKREPSTSRDYFGYLSEPRSCCFGCLPLPDKHTLYTQQVPSSSSQKRLIVKSFQKTNNKGILFGFPFEENPGAPVTLIIMQINI